MYAVFVMSCGADSLLCMTDSNVVSIEDVCTAAHRAVDSPPVEGRRCGGPCARCGRESPGNISVRSVVSRTFTAFDGWSSPAAQGMCQVCAWVYRTSALRLNIQLVGACPPTLKTLTSRQLGARLQKPLTSAHALVVPVGMRRKHLLPHARWGEISVDDISLSWTKQDVHTLAAMRRLRADGFGERMLAASAPQFAMMRRLPAARWTGLLEDWAELDRWRAAPPWWELGLRASSSNRKEP